MPGRSAVVAALLLIGSPLKAQVSITTGNCTPNAAALEDRVACFVMVRKYDDADGVIRLIAPSELDRLATEFRARLDLYNRLPGRSPSDRLAALVDSLGLKQSANSRAQIATLHEEIFRRIERGESSSQLVVPYLRIAYLPHVLRPLAVEPTEVSIAERTDSSATLYLTERVGVLTGAQHNSTVTRYIFLWRRIAAVWYIVGLRA